MPMIGRSIPIPELRQYREFISRDDDAVASVLDDRSADAEDRAVCAYILAHRGNPQCVTALLRAISDPSDLISSAAMRGLGVAGSLRATRPISDVARDCSMSVDRRLAAISALMFLEDPRAIRILNLIMGRDPQLAEAARSALDAIERHSAKRRRRKIR